MKIELNDRYLRSLMKPDMEHMEVSDTKRTGLRIRVYPRTSKLKEGRIVFMYEKRVKNGPKRKHTFGAWPQLSLAEARQMALEIELEANKGIDRVERERQQQLIEEAAKAGLTTVSEVIATYDQLHLSTIKTRDERNRQLKQSLEKHLNKSIKDLTRKDLQQAVDDKANAGRKPYANRIRGALVAFAKWAWVRGYIDNDIGAGIAKATREVARDRVLTIAEVQTIWNATYEMGELWGPLLRLVILTGQRRSEIAELQWSEIDLVKAQIVKSGEQTKNGKPHTTHLATPALLELQQLSKSKNSDKWVFTTTGTTPVSGLSKVKSRLDKILGDEFEPWRVHDIRTGLSSALAEADVPENITDRILNHSASGSAPSAVARVYNQAEMLPQRARALDKWANMVTGKTGNVVKLHG